MRMTAAYRGAAAIAMICCIVEHSVRHVLEGRAQNLRGCTPGNCLPRNQRGRQQVTEVTAMTGRSICSASPWDRSRH
jgi:hypothetical protein